MVRLRLQSKLAAPVLIAALLTSSAAFAGWENITYVRHWVAALPPVSTALKPARSSSVQTSNATSVRLDSEIIRELCRSVSAADAFARAFFGAPRPASPNSKAAPPVLDELQIADSAKPVLFAPGFA